MNHPGNPNPAPKPERKLREWTVGGRVERAHYVAFERNHVCFWEITDDNQQNILVAAYHQDETGLIREIR